jgi:hypothetical protein
MVVVCSSSFVGGLVASILVLSRREHVQCAVPSAGVVPDLDVVVDRSRQLDPCPPAFAVQQLDLHSRPDDSIIALSYGAPTAPIDGARSASLIF